LIEEDRAALREVLGEPTVASDTTPFAEILAWARAARMTWNVQLNGHGAGRRAARGLQSFVGGCVG
jgi:hypothetical protein